MIKAELANRKIECLVETDDGPDDWEYFDLCHLDKTVIARVERNPVVEGGLGSEELKEFIENIQTDKPDSAVKWLTEYLPQVKSIYAFQILHGTDVQDGWDKLDVVREVIGRFAPSIHHADQEGFYFADGGYFLWQFSDTIKGTIPMAVMKDGMWVKFLMNIGDQTQREFFWKGAIPPGAKLIK